MSGGTTPPGATGERQAAEWVRQMFARVAPRYDLLNHILSFNIDKSWRKRLIERVQPVLNRDDATIVDLCCGTGDVLIELQGHTRSHVAGADFCHPMLVAAAQKIQKRRYPSHVFEGDALRLPLRPNSIDLITIAFGFRNLTNYDAGLLEFQRALRPGGILAILEFSHPRQPLVRIGYGMYSRFVLPTVGALISGSREAYAYLPASIGRFPRAGKLAEMMESAGFTGVSYELLTGGIAALHIGRKK